MASQLQEEVTCPICSDILREPVTIDCGHSFCFVCISQVEGMADNLFLCPLCKASMGRRTFSPNWLLVSLVEKIQAMDATEISPEEAELRCQRHGQKLRYFCEEDGEFLCTVCHDSDAHKFHNASLIEDAAQNYQELIQLQVEQLEQLENEAAQESEQGERMIRVFSAQVLLERLRILGKFKSLKKDLEEEESFLLSQLDWLEQEGPKQMKVFVTDTQEKLSALRNLSEFLKVKQQMPPRQLLQDINVTLSRCERFQCVNSAPVPVYLKEKINEAKSRHDSVIEKLKKIKVWLSEKNDAESPASGPVTLDAGSAHPDLILSQDLKTVTLYMVSSSDSEEPEEPQRFYPFQCVLGSPGLSAGSRAWEVELEGPEDQAWGIEGTCEVGVASELAPRRGCLQVMPLSGFWALRITGSGCQPLTDSYPRETLQACPRKVGVYVDHDCGEVVFYDATTSNHIYTFRASFSGQVFPFFRILVPGTQITLSP